MIAMTEANHPRDRGRWTAFAMLVLALAVTAFAWWREREGARLEELLQIPQGQGRFSPWMVLAGGLGVSLLVTFVFLLQAERRRAAELRTANERLTRLAALADATTDFVGAARMDGRALFLNQAGRRMVGLLPDEDLSELPAADFYSARTAELFDRDAIPKAIRDGTWSGEVALKHRDGHEIPVSFVGLVFKSPDGLPEYMACIARDISEQRRLEENLRAALAEAQELNHFKSQLISMVSHEIRTPLAMILGSSEILSRYFDRLPAPKRQRQLDTINSAVQRMSALVEELLLFSRAEARGMEFHPAPLDLTAFCQQLADELLSATGRRCVLELNPAELSVLALGDETLLRHIFSNLLTNAAKYSPPESPVNFHVRRLENGEGIFIVQDLGMGIPEADRQRLFTPFYRAKNAATIPGTGLGLAIVQHCVHSHGGRLEIDSREGAGTTVTVRLPLFPSCQPQRVQPPAATNRLTPP
jgi:PAS domain S-box-containing protein